MIINRLFFEGIFEFWSNLNAKNLKLYGFPNFNLLCLNPLINKYKATIVKK